MKNELDKEEEHDKKAAKRFLVLLSVISILGFISIIFETFFSLNIEDYVESIWILIIGVGLIIEVKFSRIRSIKKLGLDRDNFNYLITTVIGLLAVFAGIFTIPQIKIDNPAFMAVKGILSLIAIAIISIETWYMNKS